MQALDFIQVAIDTLHRRTQLRDECGVEGTHQV